MCVCVCVCVCMCVYVCVCIPDHHYFCHFILLLYLQKKGNRTQFM